MRCAKYIFSLCLVFSTFMMSYSFAVDRAALKKLVDQLPAENAQIEQEIMAGLTKLGTEGIQSLCGELVPPGSGDDTGIRYALHGLAMYVNRPGSENLRSEYAKTLCTQLNTISDKEVKAFLIRQLQLTGKSESVDTLVQFLNDAQLCEPATQALLRIGGNNVGPALSKALAGADEKNRITLIQALGQMQVSSAAPNIRPFVSDNDRNLRLTAIRALANMGDKQAVVLLKKPMADAGGYEKAQITAFYLLLAERLGQAGDTTSCLNICRELLAKTDVVNNIPCEALALLVETGKSSALDDLIKALKSQNYYLQCQAIALADKIPGPNATQRWTAVLKEVNPDLRTKIVTMLGKRNDKAALPAIIQTLNDSELAVRIAAIDTVAKLGGDQAIAPLIRLAMDTQDKKELEAGVLAMMHLKGAVILERIAQALDTMKPTVRSACLEGMAMRPEPLAFDIILKRTQDDDRNVRVNAWRVLGRMAPVEKLPVLVDTLMRCDSNSEQTAAGQAVVAVAGALDNTDKIAEMLLARLSGANDDQTRMLLTALGQLGGQKALDELIRQTTSSNDKARDAAVRALAKWSDASGIPALLKIVQQDSNLTYRVLAFRQCLTLLGETKANAQKVSAYSTLLNSAPRPDEKKLALTALAEMPSIETLKLAAGCLDDTALQTEAVRVIVAIACPSEKNQQGLTGPETVAILKKALSKTDDAKVQEAINQHLTLINLPANGNVALNRPVTISVAHQGDHLASYAVDGKTDRELAYWGAAWPSWLQVDLQQTVTIDTAQIFFYWDGNRYYQYNLEVSKDGLNWQTVADRSQTTQPATPAGELLKFNPVAVRYVRVNILKNSANEAVHIVELKVFTQGDGPAPPPDPVVDNQAGLREPPPGFTALFKTAKI